MQAQLSKWLAKKGIDHPDLFAIICVLALIVGIGLIIHLFLRFIVRPLIERELNTRKTKFDPDIVRRLFSRIAWTIQGWVVYLQAELWLEKSTTLYGVLLFVSRLWMLLFVTLTFFAILDLIRNGVRNTDFVRTFPLGGVMQAIKVLVSIVVGILVISMLIDKSPIFLLSGLGAMTAVLMLVFKEPILGFASGIQLSANNMLSVGDWLEMPAPYDANGIVIDIGLTTIKVRNWDNTITSLPTSALISTAFKNWEAMKASGGRRIQRSIWIDIYSIHFLTDEEIAKLRKVELLQPYFETKLKEIEDYNKTNNVDMSCAANGMRLTNIGVFREYLVQYLRHHPQIHQGMTLMVRQMEPNSNGTPLEIYCFSNVTEWVHYEAIKTELFEHTYAVLPTFGLRTHQFAGDTEFSLPTTLPAAIQKAYTTIWEAAPSVPEGSPQESPAVQSAPVKIAKAAGDGDSTNTTA